MTAPYRRNARWRRVNASGTEEAVLYRHKRHFHLDGKVETSFVGVPARVSYSVVCDETWSTRTAGVLLHMEQSRSDLFLVADDERHWRVNGAKERSLDGCEDVDLSVTPATNTLPLRRLQLREGGSAEVLAVWVRFPDMTVQPSRQHYTRLARNRYRYEGLDSGFSAEIQVDEDGLVTSYPGLWERAP